MPDTTHPLQTAEGMTVHRMNEREDYPYRESIWSVSRTNLNLYSVLFPVLWLAGTVYMVVFVLEPWRNPTQILPSLFVYMGTIGISSAVLSLMIVAGKDFVMVLFDWANKAREKARREGYEEGYAAAVADLKDTTSVGDSKHNGDLTVENPSEDESEGNGQPRRP